MWIEGEGLAARKKKSARKKTTRHAPVKQPFDARDMTFRQVAPIVAALVLFGGLLSSGVEYMMTGATWFKEAEQAHNIAVRTEPRVGVLEDKQGDYEVYWEEAIEARKQKISQATAFCDRRPEECQAVPPSSE